MRINTRKS